jgi:Tfp pilus assembly protein PilF
LSERNGQVDRAREQFHRALTMAPTHVEGLIEFGRLEDRQGRLDVAERHYRTAVNLNPHHATGLNDLALCMARQGKLDESVHLLQRAIDIQPDKALYRNNMATVLVEQQRDQEALTNLAAVHGPAAANYNLGLLLSKRGRPQDAQQYFAAALEIEPQMTQASAALAAVGGNVPRMVTRPQISQPAHAMGSQSAQPQGPQFVAPQGTATYRPSTAYVPQRGALRTLPPVGPGGVPLSR